MGQQVTRAHAFPHWRARECARVYIFMYSSVVIISAYITNTIPIALAYQSTMDTNKEHIYLQNMQRSMVEVYAQIEQLLATIPDDIDEKDLTPEQCDAVLAVEAIESEWILDPEMRKEMSCINWTDD